MRKVLAVAAAAAGMFTTAYAQGDGEVRPDIVLTNSAIRDGIVLTGPADADKWAYSIDPYRDGVAGFHGGGVGTGHQRYDPVDVDEATRANPLALYEYDMRREKKVSLPGSWDFHAPEMRHYEGLVWYERGFDAELPEGHRAFLRFGAVNYSAEVWLNGEHVGSHEGGFTPFAFEVTDLVKDGENRVALGVDSTRTENTVPPVVTDWETLGGITRPVKLVIVPETFIDDAWIRLSQDGEAILADIQLDGPDAANHAVSVEIGDTGYTLSGPTDASGLLQTSIPVPDDLQLWSPDSPTLYDITIVSGDDSLEERIGFRTITVDGEDILLNGESIFLRGICMHEEEFGPKPARLITEENARELLTEIKEGLNGNFVRLAHYPHSEVTTRLADEMGLLVWSEIPVYWRVNWENEEALATARSMLAENIMRDRNRASIVLWSIGNETPVSDARNTFLRQLARDVKALDDTRLLTAALLSSTQEEDGVVISEIDDPLTENLDVMSVNTYHGWYGGIPLAEVSEIRWRSDFNKPLIFSEYGAGAKQGFKEPDLMRKFSEDYQREYYRETLEMSDHVTFLRGMSPWILKDFLSPRRQHPVYQEGWNRKGLLSPTGERKEAFFVLSDHYKEMKEAEED